MTNHWAQLKATQATQATPALLLQRMPNSPKPGILVGLDATGHPLAIVELGAQDAPNLTGMQRYGNIQVTAVKNSGFHDLQLALHDPSVIDAFGALVDYMRQALDGKTGVQQRLDATQAVLRNIEEIIRIAQLAPLTPEQQRGLIAELHVLVQVLVPRIGPVRSVQAWTGPDWRSHDFQFDALDIEVKSILSNQDPVITISSGHQLRPRNGSIPLKLVAIEIDRTPNGQSLPQHVAAARAALAASAAALADLNNRLMSANYSDAHAPFYTDQFQTTGADWFRIDATFPQATENSPAVGNLKFTVDLRGATTHQSTENAIDPVGKKP